MSETAEIYKRVCEKCPAAIVEWLGYDEQEQIWFTQETSEIYETTAEALIVHHWLALLPTGVGIAPFTLETIGRGYVILDSDNPKSMKVHPTPFLALASYLERLP